jgi:endo-1,3-1,4-beta-glycanase ExoK
MGPRGCSLRATIRTRARQGVKHTVVLRSTLGLATTTLLALCVSTNADAKPYKGGEILSSQAYQYGRMEMRMRMARGSGILSTFFTYKDGSEIEGTFWEEIDIEVFGKDDATGWQSNIITGVGTRTTSEQEHTSASLADDYHTYALEWTPTYVAWELDGVVVRRTEGGQVPDLTSPQTLRFNLWAANIEEWVGPFDDAVLPQYQFVSWIRYSRYESGQFILEWTDDFDTFDTARWGRADWTFAENLVDFDPNNALVRDGTLVLALTREGQTGFDGAVPFDDGGNVGGAGGNASNGGAGGAGSGPGGSGTGEGGGAGAVSGGTTSGGAAPGGGGAVSIGGAGVVGGGGITGSNGGAGVVGGGGITGPNGGGTVGTAGGGGLTGGAAPSSSGAPGVIAPVIGAGNAGAPSAVPPIASSGSAGWVAGSGDGPKGCGMRTLPRQSRDGMGALLLCFGLALLRVRARVRLKRHALP